MTKDLSIFQQTFLDQRKQFEDLERNGAVKDLAELVQDLISHYLHSGNAKRIKEIYEYIHRKKSFRLHSAYAKCCHSFMVNDINMASIVQLRQACFLGFKNESKAMQEYLERIKSLGISFPEHHEIIENESQLVYFIKNICRFDDTARELGEVKTFDFNKSWLIKQLILTSEDYYLINYAILSLFHGFQVQAARELYLYALSLKIQLLERVKYWALKNGWETQSLYLKKEVNDQTQILTQKDIVLPIKKMLESSSKQPFLTAKESREIIDIYRHIQKTPVKDEEIVQELARCFSDDMDKIHFYLENQFYDQAWAMLRSILNTSSASPGEVDINIYYLALFALHGKKAYNEAIDFIREYELNWSAQGAEAIELWYLSAECCFFVDQFDIALKYYQKIRKKNSSYRLVKARIEEIEARK